MIRKSVFALVLLIFAAGAAHAASWSIDQSHSYVGFSVKHLVVSKVKGSFGDYTGKINFDGKDFSAASVEATVQMVSVDTDNKDRDDHLRNNDFFDVEKFPTMTFKSKKITAGGKDKFTMVGDLTIKDVTKEVTFEGEFNGTINDPWGNTRAGFSAETKIDRQDFNVSFSKALDGGGLVVGDEVTIILEVEAIQDK